MARIDLHVHSMYSKQPTQWLLQRIGTQESYTDIEEVYTIAKNRGMDFVTITDHNAIEGALKLVEHHPDDTFVSVEVTTYFPENGCKIHVLIYDLNEQQFREINRIRSSIYDLHNYLQEENLAHSVAHATLSINGKLTFETLEKLILLFDVFEGLNGARDSSYNMIWRQVLMNLAPEDIERLYDKHHIEPFSDDPWTKGFTGGSDDHAGLFIGQTFTVAECKTLDEYIQSIREKRTIAKGRSSDFKMMAFTFYKVACDFSTRTTANESKGLLGLVNSILFENKRPSIRSRLAMRRMKSRRKNDRDKIVVRFLNDLIADFVSNGRLSIDEKIDKIYDGIAVMADDFLAMILASLENDFKNGNMSGLIESFSAILPAIFLSAPFFSALKYLSRERELSTRLKTEFIDKDKNSENRTLWFSDTVHDLDGVATTLQNLTWNTYNDTHSIKLVISSPGLEKEATFPFTAINLPSIYSYTPDFYKSYTLHVVSLLKSIEMIYKERPDEIIISTPGPIGLLGLMAAKFLGIPTIGIYHTDYTERVKLLANGDLLTDPIESYTRWFYSFVDEVYVPTQEYITILEERGFTTSNMKILPGGIDTTVFAYNDSRSLLLGQT